MGIIINPSRGVTHYASINRNGVHILKKTDIEVQTDENGNLHADETGNQVIINPYRELGYVISAHFSVWDNEQHYRDRDITQIIYSREVQVTTTTPPMNVYELLYNKFKTTLQAHTDDI